MANETFQIGDTVQLKSGGPSMTINFPGSDYLTGAPDGNWDCVWFDGSDLKNGTFNPAVLKKSILELA